MIISGRPTLAFLWRACEISGSVVNAARETSTSAIFDLGPHPTGDTAKALKAAGAEDMKITAEYLMDPSAEKFIRESGVTTLWVEYNPVLESFSPQEFIKRLGELSSLLGCIPVSGDLEFLALAVSSGHPLQGVALKGAEAAGFTGRETAGILYTFLRETASRESLGPGLILWGGVATPEAVAAFLCTGARGVVFESLHWQTDLVQADRNLKKRLSKFRPEHTTMVGADIGVPCRFFDKGNSPAIKELKKYEASLFKDRVTDDDRRAFALRVKEAVKPALESDLDRRDLVFLGPEAAFAEAFAERFGRNTFQALAAFVEEIEGILEKAPGKLDGLVKNRAADSLGTRYPFIQGAMSWISDIPEFALAVSEAGGLPTIALGLKSRQELEADLDRIEGVMGGNPYAVNLVALPENPHLREQLDWIEEKRPPFTVIAAGDPARAARLQEKGIETIYIASNEDLIRLAAEAGVRFIVLEGNEAGGHVGEHSTLTLAQIALELRRREPSVFKDRFLVIAGGIFNRETAFRAFMLGADAIQMGTAYVATREIVETGALDPLYQRLIVGSRPGSTRVSGESIGLRVRSLKTPKMEAIGALEREWVSGRHDEASFRRRLEALSTNSLLIAARGIKRPGGSAMDEESRIREGQFMSGAISGVVSRVLTLSEFHRDLAEGPLELTKPAIRSGPAPAAGLMVKAGKDLERVAITAMALVNSLGNSPEEIWEACLALKSGITTVPSSRWDHALYYDPDPRARGKTYCNAGAFQNINISRKELGIAPQDFRSMSDSTKLTLWLAEKVIRESGLLESGIPRERIGVIVSQNSGETAATITDLVLDVYNHDIVRSVGDIIPMEPELEKAVKEKIMSGRLTVDDTTLLGRLNCAAGGFICNRYGLQGPSYSVSAACATSLVALYSAIQMIRNGIIDAAIVGGGEEELHPSHYLEFSALKALAGLSGLERPVTESSRPFDTTRDGMVLGEGGGMIVVEKASVAERRGVFVHAYITGIGASNNDRGMVEPLAETEMIAIGASFRDAGYGADNVDLVECHATSTVQGDIEEVKALKEFFPSSCGTALSSFKSQIGHTLGASGISSLIRGIIAMKSGIFPPTLNYRNPDARIGLEAAGFHAPVQPAEWPRRGGRPRHLEVNAFGFGGANYVVQLEESMEASGRVMISPESPVRPESRESRVRDGDVSIPGVSFITTSLGGLSYRLGVVAADEGEASAKIESLASMEQNTLPSGKALRAMARQGIFAAGAEEKAEGLAFLFTGQGSQYVGMSSELYRTFPEIRRWMDMISEVAEFDLLDLLFNSTEENLQKTRWQQPALYTMEYAIARYLISMGAQPRAMAGHSLGELVALSIAGVFSHADGFRIVNKRAQCMDKAAGLRGDPGTMIAVDAPMAYLEEKVEGRENVYFTNYNSPHQVVLGGDTEPVLALMGEIKGDGHRATQLKVSMAFHSPLMKVIHGEMAAFVADIPFHPPRIPVISNTTMEPFPDDPDRIRQILMAHLESPVRWMQNIRTLRDDFGIGHFTEIGPKDTLCSLVSEILENAVCFPTCMPDGEAYAFRSGVARLYALGHLAFEGIPMSLGADRRPGHEAAPPGRPGIAPGAPPRDRMVAIVQREINAFVLESFGRILKPQIAEAIRRELDPRFTPEQLDRILEETLRHSTAPGPPTPIPTPIPAPAGADESAGKRDASAVALGPGSERVPEPVARTPLEDGKGDVDYLEKVIHIIMSATGYERDEIEPDMDIRQDLAIRSSRLPVIMDEVEREFGITVNVEDFIGLNTVREIAGCIENLAEHGGAEGGREKPPTGPSTASARPVEGGRESEPERKAALKGVSRKEEAKEEWIHRMVLEEAAISPSPLTPVTLKPGREVALITTDSGSSLAAELSGLMEERFGARTILLDCSGRSGVGDTLELRTSGGAQRAAKRLAEAGSLAGLVLVLEGGDGKALPSGTADVSAFLTGFFGCLKSLLGSENRAFCMSLAKDVRHDSAEMVCAEGIIGMLLAAAQEYPSMLFRSVTLDGRTDLRGAMDLALDTSNPIIELIFHDGEAFSIKAVDEPLSLEDRSGIRLGNGDVVVISGGARGVTYHIARALAPFKLRLVLLGRTELDTAAAYGALRRTGGPGEKAVGRFFEKRGITPGVDKPGNDGPGARAGLEIARNVSRLSVLGLRVSYHCCDVSDPEKVARTLKQVVKQYGRIDGIIHGAGIIRDAFVESMTPEDFRRVVDVKLLGAWNLYCASRENGLRFFAGLSSLAAIQGNVGQANYCAANRSLSALLRSLPDSPSGLVSKAFMLPPIVGTGMAEDPEVKALMKLKGLEPAFVHADELAQMFCRELILGPPQRCWVIPARTFPGVRGTLVEPSEPGEVDGEVSPGGVRFEQRDFPMIHTIDHLDLKEGEIVATRNFSRDFDLWVEDHKPFKFLKHPLVSGIMAVETILEAAQLLYPHLSVLGVRGLRFEDILECPPGIDRDARITCRRQDGPGPEVTCDVRFSSADVSPSGNILDRWSTNYRGEVILGPGPAPLPAWPGFEIRTSDLETRAVESREIIENYEKHTGLAGRYRVLHSIHGTGAGVVKGEMVYPGQEDMAGMEAARYLYPPYLLEALMHLFAFHAAARAEEQSWNLIPAGMEEMRFSRPARNGERFTLEARLRSRDRKGCTWDARAIDESGTTAMQVLSVRMNRFER
ncbi:MAG: SDR family NAD(P)-dependent oxidoreductase [Deltaproteobacteria bacterium]|nr:SDR family NAD(P)-dependent oxidoreductase [Deltaproteobacteria bacterium]